ncbi:protein of unknown function [Microbacterium sp. Nx66]|nr:protein of unknown function [Microbacterium sp. Nx66]
MAGAAGPGSRGGRYPSDRGGRRTRLRVRAGPCARRPQRALVPPGLISVHRPPQMGVTILRRRN